ncbi:hypothetical protein O6H91_02G113100 [Diphasiastrum complanatum]|uniref:Uncharacterized protein n=1 Tax=Diphasiastrum complanatum TaxID=34168 RepID=A0ACC2EJH4_DIPCM|nr:hypothetical protein O6H91_02G113100 [Diphasiastrum complanatum]
MEEQEKFLKQSTTIGKASILGLIHQVDDKLHVRSSGRFSLTMQQPLHYRSRV